MLLALNHIISANEGCKKISRSFLQFSETEKITSNAINEKQPRFRRTEKTAGRKRKAPLRKPSEGEKIKLLENLQQNRKNEGENSVTNSQNSNSDQTSGRDNEPGTTSELGPSVAPYPPLRLVRPSQPANVPIQTTEPLLNVFQQQGLPSSYRIPPSLYGRRITVIQNNRKQDIIFHVPSEKPDDNL